MRDTPRTFVGSVVLVLDGPVDGPVADAACAAVRQLPGVGRCEPDPAGGTLVVTARSPVDRAEVVALLHRLGCRVRP